MQSRTNTLEGGPRLDDGALFELVKPLNAKLQAARSAAGQGDFCTARKTLCDYVRNRTIPTWHAVSPPPRRAAPEGLKQMAERALRHEFTVCHVDHRFDGTVDWFFNATRDRPDIAYTKEWTWQLNRMSFWRTLGTAYRTTGDERYARAFADQLESWVRACPRPDDNGNYEDSAWRTIEAGIRMGNTWPEAFHSFLRSPSFTDDHLILYMKSTIEHAEHLIGSQDPPRHNNWVIIEMNGLYAAGVVFPEITRAQDWRAFALGRLAEEQQKQFLPDGFQFELTTGYHNVSLSCICRAVELAMATNRQSELPDGMIAGLEKAFDVNLYMMAPNGFLPAFNDAGNLSVAPILKQALRFFPERDDYRWAATGGAEGRQPARTSVFFDHAGYAVMRSGWDKDATTLYFDNGPVGASHVHQDKLSIVLFADGRELLFDAGGGMYDNGPFRRYDISTFSHNTITVDGQQQERPQEPPSPEPVDAEWQSTPNYDYASGAYTQGYGRPDNCPATHHREVLFLKPGIVVVADRVEPQDSQRHTFQSRWHVRATETCRDETTNAVTSVQCDQPNVSIVPISPGIRVSAVSGQTDPDLSGWYVKKDQQHEPATTVAHAWETDVPFVALTLLLVLPPGQELSVEGVDRRSERETHVRFSNGSRIAVQMSAPAGTLQHVKEVQADGATLREYRRHAAPPAETAT